MPTFRIKSKSCSMYTEKNSLFLNLPMIEPFLGVRQSRLFPTRLCNLALPYPEYPSLWVYNQAFSNSEYPSPWVYNRAFLYQGLSSWVYKELSLLPSTHYPGFTIWPSLISRAASPWVYNRPFLT